MFKIVIWTSWKYLSSQKWKLVVFSYYWEVKCIWSRLMKKITLWQKWINQRNQFLPVSYSHLLELNSMKMNCPKHLEMRSVRIFSAYSIYSRNYQFKEFELKGSKIWCNHAFTEMHMFKCYTWWSLFHSLMPVSHPKAVLWQNDGDMFFNFKLLSTSHKYLFAQQEVKGNRVLHHLHKRSVLQRLLVSALSKWYFSTLKIIASLKLSTTHSSRLSLRMLIFVWVYDQRSYWLIAHSTRKMI